MVALKFLLFKLKLFLTLPVATTSEQRPLFGSPGWSLYTGLTVFHLKSIRAIERYKKCKFFISLNRCQFFQKRTSSD